MAFRVVEAAIRLTSALVEATILASALVEAALATEAEDASSGGPGRTRVAGCGAAGVAPTMASAVEVRAGAGSKVVGSAVAAAGWVRAAAGWVRAATAEGRGWLAARGDGDLGTAEAAQEAKGLDVGWAAAGVVELMEAVWVAAAVWEAVGYAAAVGLVVISWEAVG